MKNTVLIFILTAISLAITSCAIVPSDNAQESNISAITAESYSTSGYTLKWSDEFNGTSVDTTKWVFDTGGGGWGNSELEYYQSKNATVSGGYLNITAKKESVGGYAYTSARMKTLGKYSFQYGKIVARIKMPVGQGYWPGFWMLGTSGGTWPANGEIDVMENINGANTVYATTHWYQNGHANYGTSTACTVNSFHDYEVEWTSTMIYARVDGVQFYAIDTTPAGLACFRSWPFYILLNFAVGGTWPGNPNSSTVFPATMQVDYVRVYQK